jgi:preprotein translocase subunit SecF
MQPSPFDRFFDRVDITKHPAKKLITIPLVILLISFAVIAVTQLSLDSPIRLGTDFKGGTVVRLTTLETIDALELKFATFPVESVRDTGGADEKSIEFGQMSEPQKDDLIALLEADYGSFELRDISPLFGKELQGQAMNAVLIAFALMAFVVFIVFRSFIPPLAIIYSPFSNIVVAVACMDLIGLELSLGTVAALLMLIGYSVDSNILLTTNLLKKKGGLNEKVRNTMKTGITMTFTTLAAVLAIFLVSSSIHLFSAHFAPIPILRDISLVLLVGLTMDLLNTWLFNAGVLRWYLERKEPKKVGKGGEKKAGKKDAKRKRKSSTA